MLSDPSEDLDDDANYDVDDIDDTDDIGNDGDDDDDDGGRDQSPTQNGRGDDQLDQDDPGK